MNPGEIYEADFPDAGLHRIIIVSRAELNRGNRVQAVPVTSKYFDRRSKLPTCVPFRAGEYGFTENCVAQCDAVNLVPLSLIVNPADGPLALLPEEVFRELIVSIGYVLDSSCEPN